MAIKIYVDQGHGPTVNAGAQGFGLYEQDITYMVGAYLSDILSSDYRFEVRTSRASINSNVGYNNSSSLRIRVDEANSWPAEYFLRYTTMTSVLVELAYISNYEDSLKLTYDQYQFAYGIYVGLLNYLGLPQL